MALATYTDLTAAVAGWLNRTDLTAQIPDFIALAEAEFNRVLRLPEMETRATLSITSGSAALPAGCIGVRSVTYNNKPLKELSPADLLGLNQAVGGDPRWYAISDGKLYILSAGTVTVTLVYHAAIPPLVTASTNFLMTRAPDLYLFGALLQAEFYGFVDERLSLIKGRVDEIMGQLTGDAVKRRYSGSPLAARLPVSPTTDWVARG